MHDSIGAKEDDHLLTGGKSISLGRILQGAELKRKDIHLAASVSIAERVVARAKQQLANKQILMEDKKQEVRSPPPPHPPAPPAVTPCPSPPPAARCQ